MDGMEAVAEPMEGAIGGENESPSSVSSAEFSPQTQTEQQTPEDPYSSKSSKEYSAWLKGLKDSDPANAKFARLSKDNHARLYQLQQMEPRGIDGVRETYALLQSVQHGELTGVEALNALQDEIRGISDIDARIAAADPTVLDEFDDSMRAGIVKMAPAILDMARSTDPEGYAAAVLPHFVEALRGSELVGSFNSLVDVLNEQPPRWLTENQKTDWTNDRLQRVMTLAGKMGSWFNAQQQKAGELPKQAGGKPTKNGESTPSEVETARANEQKMHWNTNIQPQVDQYAEKKFEELFRPYDKRLRLDKTAKDSLKGAFIQGVVKKAVANPVYKSQMARYNAQRNPDPKTVINFARVEFDKHAKTVMDSLTNERYKPFLSGRPNTAGNGTQRPPNGAQTPPSPGVQVVSVKPTNIDFKNTPREWIHQKKYRLTDGKTVQWRPNV